jgi:hypothetical protein
MTPSDLTLSCVTWGAPPHDCANSQSEHSRSFALNVSNVKGPRRPVHVLRLPVRSFHSVAEIRERHALRVAVMSLADTISFGLCADPTLIPDVDKLAEFMQVEATVLADCELPQRA